MAVPPQIRGKLGLATGIREVLADNLAARLRMVVHSPDLPRLREEIDCAMERENAPGGCCRTLCRSSISAPCACVVSVSFRRLRLAPLARGTGRSIQRSGAEHRIERMPSLRCCAVALPAGLRRRPGWTSLSSLGAGQLAELVVAILVTLSCGWCSDARLGQVVAWVVGWLVVWGAAVCHGPVVGAGGI